MSEHSQNNPAIGKTGASPARKLSCEEWETLLVDFLDGALPPKESELFHSHQQSCAACAEMFAQARRGREWLSFLRVEPEAPASLVSNILAQTSGAEIRAGHGELIAAASTAIPVAPVLPLWKRGGTAVVGYGMSQSRLLMTAAMAFFSITLTLNMAGVRLSAVRLADLKPTAVGSNLDKQFHMASARVIRYYDNVRFFYMMEAQVKELRRNADLQEGVPADKPDDSAPATSPQNGDHKNGGKSQAPSGPSSSEQPHALLWGDKVEAELRNPLDGSMSLPANRHQVAGSSSEGSTEITDSRAADQVERGIA